MQGRLAKEAQALAAEEAEQDLGTVLEYLERERHIRAPSVGLLGFEAGAATAHHVACMERPPVGAAVALYGIAPDADALARVPVLAVIGDRDPLMQEGRRQRLHAGFARLDNGSRLEILSGAGRGFFDPARAGAPRGERSFVRPPDGLGYFDVRVPRYFERDACDAAWKLTLDFLKGHLRR
jgi:dienelactone hydrolase